MNKKIETRLAIFFLILIFIIGIVPNCLAAEKQNLTAEKQKMERWEKEYTETLTQPVISGDEKKALLLEAVTEALDVDAPPCECMRIAIGLDYKPYFVMRYIYEHNKGVKLDELCWCATSDGIEKHIIARAAADAKKSNNDPVFRQNEIAKSECIKSDEGLAYTAELNPPEPIDPPPDPPNPPVSPITP